MWVWVPFRGIKKVLDVCVERYIALCYWMKLYTYCTSLQVQVAALDTMVSFVVWLPALDSTSMSPPWLSVDCKRQIINLHCKQKIGSLGYYILCSLELGCIYIVFWVQHFSACSTQIWGVSARTFRTSSSRYFWAKCIILQVYTSFKNNFPTLW